ncbi:MAG: helix-turn-helix transcriptional regulator [Eggerthellaceae bacterium]|nr:helix-turn-helix transcriptional regulator [Eggerthellaceae bacterium]
MAKGAFMNSDIPASNADSSNPVAPAGTGSLPSEQPAGKPPIYLTNKFLFGFFAVAFYWAWIFSTYFTDKLVVPLTGIALPSLFLKGAGLSGAALFLFIVWKLSKYFFSERGFKLLRAIPFVCGPAASALALLASIFGWESVNPAFGIASWLFMGFGTAAALVQMDFFITRIDSNPLKIVLAAGTVLASILYIVVANMFVVASIIAIIAYAFLEGGTLCLSPRSLSAEEKRFTKKLPPAKLSGNFKQFSLQLCFYSVAFGLALCLGVSFSIHGQSPVLVWVALCLTGPFLMLFSFLLNRFLGASDISRILLACIAVALLPLPFMGVLWQVVFCAFLIFCFTCYDMLSFGSLTSIIKAENLDPVKHFSLGRLTNAIGVVIGWIVGAALFASQTIGSMVFTAVCLGCVFLLVLLLTFSRATFTPNAMSPQVHEGYWQQSCNEVSAQADLSPREAEVFSLLARGRDTEFIHNVLFISSYTVKTHTYHIYKKLDIHSQQEVINLVEERVMLKKQQSKVAAS